MKISFLGSSPITTNFQYVSFIILLCRARTKPYITGDKKRYNAYYNTYKCSALPAGPICNPSAKSLVATANPAAGDHLYFGSKSDDSYYFLTEEKWNAASSSAPAPSDASSAE